MKQRRYDYWTLPELRRMKQLSDAGMPCGSIAIALRVDFGVTRTGDTVRCALRRHFPEARSLNHRPNLIGTPEGPARKVAA